MKINFHDLQSQYSDYKDEINFAVQKVFDSCQFIMGPEVFELEQALASYLDCKNVVTCASGTDALFLALMAINLKPGDEVITTPFTFIATAEVVSLLGAQPVFADIQHHTYNIDPAQIEKQITARTRAIIPVSLYGQPADMDEINALAAAYGKMYGHKIYVIEDAAQSFGAQYKGRQSATLSDIGCLSFFPTKPLGCYGDGGAVIIKDNDLAEKIKSLRVHGQAKRYYHKYIGINGRLDTVQAAILLVKLKYFNNELKKRDLIARNYHELLQSSSLILPQIKGDRTSVYAQYSIRHAQRDKIIEAFKEKNLPSAVHYPQPLHLQECFAHLNYHEGDFPNAEALAKEVMSLPMSAFITVTEQEYVANALYEILEEEAVIA